MIKAILIISLFTAITFSQVEVKVNRGTATVNLNLTAFSGEIKVKIFRDNECIYGLACDGGYIETFQKTLPKGEYIIELSSNANIIKREKFKIE